MKFFRLARKSDDRPAGLGMASPGFHELIAVASDSPLFELVPLARAFRSRCPLNRKHES
jgi:hypothetical protein